MDEEEQPEQAETPEAPPPTNAISNMAKNFTVNKLKTWLPALGLSASQFIGIIIVLVIAMGLFGYWFSQKGDEARNTGVNGFITNTSLLFPTGQTETEMASCLDAYLKKNASTKSILQAHGQDIVSAGKTSNVNPAFIVAISGIESSFASNGELISAGTFNYFSETTNGSGYKMGKSTYKVFGSVAEAVNEHAAYLRRKFLNQGKDTIEKIGAEYAPIGAANDPKGTNKEWIPSVTKFFGEIRGMCPSLIGTNELSAMSVNGKINGKTALPLKSDVVGPTNHWCSVSNPAGCDCGPQKAAGKACHRPFLTKEWPGSMVALGILTSENNAPLGEAIDLSPTGDSTVYAPFSGTIVREDNASPGRYLIIKSSDGSAFAVLGHIMPSATTGDVFAGNPVGKLWTDKEHPRGHLHFEIWINKLPVNAGPSAKPAQIWTVMKQALGF